MDGGNNDNNKHDSKHTKGKSSGTNGKHNEQWSLGKENTRTKEIGFEWKGGALKSNGKSIKWSYVRKSWLIIHTHTHTHGGPQNATTCLPLKTINNNCKLYYKL